MSVRQLGGGGEFTQRAKYEVGLQCRSPVLVDSTGNVVQNST
jgi:hypothetical protein